MTNYKFSSSKNLLTVGFIGLLMALAAFAFSLWQTPSYKSTVKLLAVFNQSNIDTYTASKTANYITGILGEVIFSDSFIDSVYKSDANLIDNLGQGSETRQKSWKKIVKTQILENRGIVVVDTYGDNKNQTKLLASAISSVIAAQHGLYDGSQDRVAIKMIDTPSIYDGWAATKIIGDTGLGLIAGLLIGFTLIVIFPNHRLFEFNKQEKILANFPTASARYQTAPAVEPAPQTADHIAAKSSNPWLDQYYEENSVEKSDRN